MLHLYSLIRLFAVKDLRSCAIINTCICSADQPCNFSLQQQASSRQPPSVHNQLHYSYVQGAVQVNARDEPHGCT
eukprot:1161021-Pelagomonas_calceolata.AAC.4